MKDLGDLMKQARDMQARLEAAQAELANVEVVGESGGGLVKVTLTGRYEARKVEIDSTLTGEDRGLLGDLVAAAVTDAARRVERMHKEKMSDFTKGLGLPFRINFPS